MTEAFDRVPVDEVWLRKDDDCVIEDDRLPEDDKLPDEDLLLENDRVLEVDEVVNDDDVTEDELFDQFWVTDVQIVSKVSR